MGPLTTSPLASESLLWKARFMRDYKTLFDANTELKSQVKTLSARVVAAEDAAKGVRELGDRIRAVEEDDSEQRGLWTKLDEDRSKRIRDLEVKDATSAAKLDRLMKRLEDLEELVEASESIELAERVDELASKVESIDKTISDLRQAPSDDFTATERVEVLESSVRRLDKTFHSMEKQVQRLDENAITETGGLRLRVLELERKCDALETGPVATTTAAPMPLHMPTPARAGGSLSDVMAGLFTQPLATNAQEDDLGDASPLVATKKTTSTKKKTEVKKPMAVSHPLDDPMDIDEPAATKKPTSAVSAKKVPAQRAVRSRKTRITNSNQSGELSEARVSPITIRRRAPKRVVVSTAQANLVRKRSTRAGHTGSKVESQAVYDDNVMRIVGKEEPDPRPIRTYAKAVKKRPLSDIQEEESNASSDTATQSPKRSSKRSKKEVGPEKPVAPVTSARSSRLFPNLKTRVEANADAAQSSREAPRTPGLLSKAAAQVRMERRTSSEATAAFAGNLLSAVAAPPPSSSSTTSTHVRRRRAPMPNLPED